MILPSSVNGGINDLPVRPIVSNLNTTTYNLAKYLSKLLSPLQQSINTVKNTKEFIEELKQQKLSQEHKMVSFDVKSLFTNFIFESRTYVQTDGVAMDSPL